MSVTTYLGTSYQIWYWPLHVTVPGGVHLTYIYMFGTRCSNRCSGMQAICARLMGGPSAFGIYMCIGLYIYRLDLPLH